MKKLLSISIVVMLVAFLATPALACGGHRGGTQSVSYTICSTQNCVKTGRHTHSGKTYTAHYYGDGHNYHDYCELEDCTVVGYHSHAGVYCFGHTYNDGHDYHGYCDVANCTLTGYHGHDGAYCFGHTVNDCHGYHHTGRGRH